MFRRDREKKLSLQMPGRRTIAGANASVTTTVVVHQPSAPVVDQQASLKPATNGTSKHNTQSVPPLVSPPHPNGTGSSGAGFSGLTTPYLPLHSGPYCPIGVASPPSPLCYDIIEEEMIFPMSDITEEDEEPCSHNNLITPKPSHREATKFRAKSPQTIPTIITEDVDSDKGSVIICDSPEERPSSWSILTKGSVPSAVWRSKSLSSYQRGVALPEPNSKSTSASSMSTMSYVEAPPSHYHTVHGTSHISHHQQCYPYTPVNTPSSMADGSVSPVGGCPVYYSKQRTRSHSGPTYPVGFTQSVRHSALISAGMATLGTSQRRRQSDDSEQASSSLRSRVSPSGSSFFDSFRPRSTSDSKSKKPSVIAAFKNNFLNRGNNHNTSNSSSSSSSSSNSCTNVSGGGNAHHHCSHCHHVHYSHPPGATCPSSGQACPCAVSVLDHQPNGCISAPPLSPSNGTGSVIDPFSLDFLYARANSVVCPECTGQATTSHPHNSHLPQRPRSRSGSSGPTSTMARVLDIFRGRSNSVAATNVAGINCGHRTITHQESICDREFEDLDENLVYVKFFKFYRCYDIVPVSAKLVVFDTQLAVKKAFFALLSNGVRAAPLWDSTNHAFVGMLTITDFILILRTYYNSPQLQMEELEDHKVDIWRNMLKEKARPLVSIGPDESLFNAIKMLIHNKVHRLPVIDPETANVLYILTHKRILKFLFLYYYNRLPMPSYLHKSLRDLPQIGTFENIAVGTQNMPLIQTLNLMVDKRVSALPIVDKKNKVVEVFAKFDVIHLAADKAYQNLDITVKKALEYRAHAERIIKCTLNDSLHTVLEKIVQAEVHRIIVVDNDDHVIGVISLSDLLTFLVLRPVGLTCSDILASQLVVNQNIKCCKVVEETAEEVAHDSQSSSGSDRSSADLTKEDRAQLGPDGLAGSLEEANQMTTSSTGSSSSATSSSSILEGVDRSANSSPSTSTAKNLSSMITSSANHTLIPPLQ